MNERKCEITFTRNNSQEAADERWTFRIKYEDMLLELPIRLEISLDDVNFSRLMASRYVTGTIRQRIMEKKT